MVDDAATRMVRLPVTGGKQGVLAVIETPPGDLLNWPGRVYPLRATTRIGRAKTNDLVLADDTVSREHCVISAGSEGFTIRDGRSANGTLVAGKKLRDGQLQGGETIRVGGYLLLFWNGAPGESALGKALAGFGVRQRDATSK